MESYTSEKARDPKFQAFREKVKMVVHPEWERPGLSGAPIPLTVKLKDGREFKVTSASSDSPYFYSDQEVMDIYVERARTVLSSKQAEQSAKMVLALDGAKDLAELMNIITFPKKD
jgi:2-methylcitrate dehydratase PrpD